MSPIATETGLIIRSQSGFFTVQTPSGVLTCGLRGRLKKGKHSSDIAAVGDRVQVSRQADGSGSIEEIEPRERVLSRMDPRPQGLYEQVLLANPDQVIYVFACAQPTPHLRMLDRFLVIAEKQHLPAIIVANKVDLTGLEKATALFGFYPDLGYPVHYTSAKTGMGLEPLRECLHGRITALAGPSGVGKSSLLNAIQPGLGLSVSHVSTAINKGRHTTTVRELFPVDDSGWVADMPGLRSLALWDMEAEELDAYFPELAPLVAHCQFSNCSHQSEPGCAVRRAVEEGKVRPERYDSYLRLRAGEE